jgi:beta-lactamase regulating signal transducer with metallopeptidase domain
MSAWMESNFVQNPQLAALWLDALLKSFVVLAFAGGLCLTLRRAAAATRHLIWFLGVVGLLLLPLLPFILPTTPRPLWTVSGGHLSGNEIALSLELRLAKSASPITEPASTEHSLNLPLQENGRPLFKAHLTRNWLSLGFGAWALGALVVLLYPVLGRIQLGRMANNAEVLATPEWTALLAEASQLLGLRRRVVLLQSCASVMPLTWGWLGPKVLLPLDAEEWPDERRRIVLLHELAHVKRWDCLTQSITRAVCALYWFNPLAWIAARQMRVERERACDDLVLNGGCKASDYAGHLVEIATTFRRAPQGAGIAMARSSNLEQRVTAIVDVSRARRLHPAGLVGILISIAAIVFYIGGYKTNAANDETKSSAVNQATLAQIEKFSTEKEAQAKMLAAAAGENILPQFQKYFDAAKKGDFQTVTNMYADFKNHHPQYSHDGKDSRPAYHTGYWQPMLEICLIYDQFAMCDSKFTQQGARGIIDSIPPGSIYFGGTDPGRGLPTAFSKSQVDADPFYTISQNPLADPTYLEYLREMYGEKRRSLGGLAAMWHTDPKLSALDTQLQAAEQNALLLELRKPSDDPERQAADKALEDLKADHFKALWSEEKIAPDPNSGISNSWTPDRVIYIPSFDEQQKCFQDYMTDAQKRFEEKKLKPGEDIKFENGHLQAGGQVAVQAINARISKLIFDKNPNREFYVEESFPHDWMYPYLEPNGLIMKINREPLAKLSDDVIQKDQDYWQARVNEWLGNWLTPETSVEAVADFATKTFGRKNLTGFTGDAAFIRDNYAPKMFSKWRMSMAGVYSWRLGIGLADLPPEYAPKNDAEKLKLMQAADFAFKQAFAICPSSPEAVFSYLNFLTKVGRKGDALAIAHAEVIIDPANEIFRNIEKTLAQEIQADKTSSGIKKSEVTAEKLRELDMLRVQKQTAYDRQKTRYEKLKPMSREDLKRALPIAYTDDQLKQLIAELDTAEQELTRVHSLYTPQHPAYQSAEATVKNLEQKISERMDGIMVGWGIRLDYERTSIDTLKKEMDEARKAVETAQ